MADPAAVIAAVGGVAATLITSVSAFLSARSNDRLKSQELRLEAMKLDQQRTAQDVGRATRDIQDTLGTLDDRTQSTQRLTEGIALAQGTTPLPTPIAPTPPVRGPAPPPVAPIPQGSQGGFRRG
jgi:hypothetical protein